MWLTSGGQVMSETGDGNHTDTISAPIVIQGISGSYSFNASATSSSALLNISGGVTGVSTAGNTTTLTLTGTNTGNNTVSGVIGDGSAGGKVALVKSGAGTWVLSADNTYTGGTTVNGGT